MTAPPPRRPWQRRKRTWAAVAVMSLALAYPAAIGPAVYAANRGWCGGSTFDAYFQPGIDATMRTPIRDAYDRYLIWWAGLGRRHAATD